MAWFKKKDIQEAEEGIPTLPELPEPVQFSLPELNNPISNKNQGNLPELPSPPGLPTLPKLPELKSEANLTPEFIKQEIMKPPQEMQKSQFQNIKTLPNKTPPKQSSQRSPQITPSSEISRPKLGIKEAEPIYVRLDKFEASLESFEEIKIKIQEVEDILKKTKEVKQKEEQELEAWEREIQTIKSRITAIDKTIFNKLD